MDVIKWGTTMKLNNVEGDTFHYCDKCVEEHNLIKSEDDVKTCSTKHDIHPKPKDSGILSNFT